MRRRTWLAGIGTSLASVFIHRQCEAAEKNRTYNGAQSSVSLDPLAFKAIEWLRKEQQPDGGFRQVRARVSNNAELSRVGSSALAGLALVRAGQNIADQSRGAALLSLAKFVCSRLNDRLTLELHVGSIINREYGPAAERAHGIIFLARVLPLLSPGDPFREELETDVKRAVAEHAKLDLKLPLVEDHQLGKVGLLPGTNFLLRQIALENARAVGVPIDSQVIHDAQRELVSTVDIKRAALRKGYREGTEFHLLAAALRSSSTAARAAAEQCRPAGAKQASLHHISRAKLETVVAANLVEFLLEQKECAVRLSKSLPRNPDLFEKSALSDGGEHFLAYAHISEALLILGDQAGYVAWQRRLRDCFERMQNSDGSWMGRNCITDPVYSTASSIYALTAERDEPLLLLQ